MTALFLIGDVFQRMAQMPDGSVDLVVTSPPFLALRSYLPADHPDKDKEIGSEETPAAYIGILLDLTAEWRRLLAPHGSIVVELGDTYSDGRVGWPLSKSLVGIPAAYELSLIHGYNMLDRRGPDSPAGRWRVRNIVVWARPNPPVGAPSDKFRPATSYLTVATLTTDRWFDLDAVRVPGASYDRPVGRPNGSKGRDRNDVSKWDERLVTNPAGAPPLDWWEITAGGYKGSHYAVYPPELCRRPIQAMCPRRVCTTCGVPSRRVTADSPAYGWTTCGCPGTDGVRLDGFHTGEGWRPGVVLDPFAGSGTTLVVCSGLSRDGVGIDLDERNAELALQRVGMFLDIDQRDRGPSPATASNPG